jgi:hypothetical protein
MTIAKLDDIVRKFEETHHQMPAYICLPPSMYEDVAKTLLGYPTDRLKMRGIPLRLVRFQRETEVILCGKSFEERCIVTPTGNVAMSEVRVGSAASVLIRIAEAYTRYLFEMDEVTRSAETTDHDRDALNRERVTVERNYAQACALYELDEGAFIANYGSYGAPEVCDIDILLGVLISEEDPGNG